MKMKILLSLIALCLFASEINAQQKTRFEIRSGLNFSNFSGKSFDKRYRGGLIPGFNVGANAEISLTNDFFLQPGLLLTTKGSRFDWSDYRVSVSYLEIPVNLIYKPQIGKGRLILGAGPYAAIAVGGHQIDNNNITRRFRFTENVTQSDLESYKPNLRRVDAGLNFLVGYQITKRFSVQLNAGLGLMNIEPKYLGKSISGSSTKNTSVGISFGYRF